jgi:hypothetical protein
MGATGSPILNPQTNTSADRYEGDPQGATQGQATSGKIKIYGEVAERLNAPVLKTGGPLRGS